MHIYAFGSVCRGEIDRYSDLDLLAITTDINNNLNSEKFSIYSYLRIKEIWNMGTAFSWHLYYESKLLFASDNTNFLVELGEPSDYSDGIKDCEKFYQIFKKSSSSLLEDRTSRIYDLSIIFLAIRNFATCFSLSMGQPVFSRQSAKMLQEKSIPISEQTYEILERSRILSTRGLGSMIQEYEVSRVITELDKIRVWMEGLLKMIVKGDL